AEEPLHLLVGAADRVHWRRAAGQPERGEGKALADYIANRKKGAGLGLPFANELVRLTGVPIGLVPCAHGGTSMDQWSPDLLDKGGDSLYGATIRRVKLLGGKAKGVLWYQGESDANPKAAPEFSSKFDRLVQSFRKDLGQPDLPFYYVQIGRHVSGASGVEWNQVQEMQRKAESSIAHSGMVTTIDMQLDDGIHVGTQDQKRTGKRMANLACHDLFPQVAACRDFKKGPRPVSAKLSGAQLRVTFDEVNGRLLSAGRIAGFSIHDAAGAELPLIFRAAFDSPTSVVLHIGGKMPDGAVLRYGAGRNPYCNVRDSADMALPVFGPMTVER
ncbi:MAG: sialate O-acetylesterase, partial [Candidatus Solibacter usitatus]|nr:sialate O-acetylesterase [Candidatus Solibacter usitatus]